MIELRAPQGRSSTPQPTLMLTLEFSTLQWGSLERDRERESESKRSSNSCAGIRLLSVQACSL